MSATIIDGAFAGPDEAGGQYLNRILSRRVETWRALGGEQLVLDGFEHSTVGGQMVLDLSAGLALVEERDALGAEGSGRGYMVWSEDVTTASFEPASASDRKDAVVIAFVDVAAGAAALGTETTAVGGQVVVVPGVSGTTTPRTDAQIQAAVGSGGWERYADVLIPAASTEIEGANVTETATRPAVVVPPPYTQSAVTTINPSAPDVATSKAIVFPEPYATAPRVLVSLSSATSGYNLLLWSTSVSTTGFTLWILRGSSSTTTVTWSAVGDLA